MSFDSCLLVFPKRDITAKTYNTLNSQESFLVCCVEYIIICGIEGGVVPEGDVRSQRRGSPVAMTKFMVFPDTLPRDEEVVEL